MDDVGKIIWSRGKEIKGIVKSISSRYCAACGRNHRCYIVRWDDGTMTKPCSAGVGIIGGTGGELIIL